LKAVINFTDHEVNTSIMGTLPLKLFVILTCVEVSLSEPSVDEQSRKQVPSVIRGKVNDGLIWIWDCSHRFSAPKIKIKNGPTRTVKSGLIQDSPIHSECTLLHKQPQDP
jgi:hypothetical protein